MAIKFISNYWRKFERPTFEKLNGLLSAIVQHVQKRRDLSRRTIIYTDPGADFEHWASAIRTVGRYSDVQDAIDHARGENRDTKIPYTTVALESKRDAVAADYYIDDTGGSAAAQIMSVLDAVPILSTVFFHAGEYTFKATITIPKRLSIVGEPGTIFRMMRSPGTFASIETMHPIHVSGIIFFSSRRVLRGPCLNVQDCTFIVNNANLSATEGIIETADLITTFQQGVSPSAAYSGCDDTFLWTLEPNTQHDNGGIDYLDLRVMSESDKANTIIRFDISSIPPKAAVVSATLVLRHWGSFNPGFNVGAYPLKRAWVENQATWNNCSTGNAWGTAGGMGETDIGSMESSAIVSSSVTAIFSIPIMVQGWIDGTLPNNGVMLIPDCDAARYWRGYDSEEWDSGRLGADPTWARPSLIITCQTIPSRIKGCIFYVSSLATPSQLYVPNSCVILHSFGGLLIEDSDVRHYDGLQWFRRGVIAQAPQKWIRILNTDIRVFEESVDANAGNVYLEDSRLYREGEIA